MKLYFFYIANYFSSTHWIHQELHRAGPGAIFNHMHEVHIHQESKNTASIDRRICKNIRQGRMDSDAAGQQHTRGILRKYMAR